MVIPDRLLTLVAEHVERHLIAGGPERWFFPTPTGTPPHQNAVGHQRRKATFTPRHTLKRNSTTSPSCMT